MVKDFLYKGLFFPCLLSVFLTGCVKTPDPLLNIGTSRWPGYEVLFLARELGLHDETGIRLVELNSATEVIHAFRNRTLEVAALTLDEVLTLMQTEKDLKIILVMDISDGGDVLLGQPGIDSLDQLNGKKIGVENTAVGAVLLDSALTQAGLAIEEVTIVSLTVDEHFDAFIKRRIDAVATYEPVKTRLENRGAINLFDSSQIPGVIVDVLVTRASFADSHRKTLQKLVKAQFKALDFLKSNPDAAATLIAPRLEIKPSEVTASYEGLILPGIAENTTLMSGAMPPLLKTARELSRLMRRSGLIDELPETSSLLDNRFLQ